MERHSFCIVSGKLLETMQKLCLLLQWQLFFTLRTPFLLLGPFIWFTAKENCCGSRKFYSSKNFRLLGYKHLLFTAFIPHLKGIWGRNFNPVFSIFFWWLCRERTFYKVLQRFDHSLRSYKVTKFWTQRKWCHPHGCAKHLNPTFL